MTTHPYYKEVKLILDKLISHNFKLIGFDDGGEDYNTTDLNKIMEGVLSVDESTVYFKDREDRRGSVLIVLDNEDGVAMADYSYSIKSPGTGSILDGISDDVYNEMNP